MASVTKTAEHVLYGSLSLLAGLVILFTLLRWTSRYAPAPISNAASYAGRAASATGF